MSRSIPSRSLGRCPLRMRPCSTGAQHSSWAQISVTCRLPNLETPRPSSSLPRQPPTPLPVLDPAGVVSHAAIPSLATPPRHAQRIPTRPSGRSFVNPTPSAMTSTPLFSVAATRADRSPRESLSLQSQRPTPAQPARSHLLPTQGRRALQLICFTPSRLQTPSRSTYSSPASLVPPIISLRPTTATPLHPRFPSGTRPRILVHTLRSLPLRNRASRLTARQGI